MDRFRRIVLHAMHSITPRKSPSWNGSTRSFLGPRTWHAVIVNDRNSCGLSPAPFSLRSGRLIRRSAHLQLRERNTFGV